MNVNELFKEMEQDFDINYDNLKDKLFEIPKLHNKYLKMYFKQKTKLLNCVNKLKALYKDKYLYYSKHYEYNLSTKEVQFFIEGDDEYQKLYMNCEKQKEIVKVLEEAVEKAKKLSFDAKNILQYLEYISGV